MKFTTATAFFLATATSFAAAQNGTADMNFDLPTSIADLTRECPTEMAALTPCIESDTSLQNCVGCVATYTMDNEDMEVVGMGNTTCFTLQDTICMGIEVECADSCGLVDSDSFFTFGSECEELFLDLTECVLSTQGVGDECPIQSCSAAATDEDVAGSSGLTVGALSVAVAALAAMAML